MAAPLSRLLRLLRAAHAGERAAAYAYRGHWLSLRRLDERTAVRAIEEEEWAHRRCLAAMLAPLGSRPARVRELVFAAIGRVLGALCFVTGWFAPMYGAGRIERRNIQEYLDLSRFAAEAGHGELVADLLAMAAVERQHEAYFRARVASHWLRRLVPMWGDQPPLAEGERRGRSPEPPERADSAVGAAMPGSS